MRKATLVLICGSMASLLPMAPAGAVPAAPEPSYSHYLTWASDSEVCLMGAETADMQSANTTDDDAFVILHFHAPESFPDGSRGASMGVLGDAKKISGVTGPQATGIEHTLQRFASCYASNNPSGSTVKIVAGVSNDDPDDPISDVSYDHGYAWGNLIVRMNNWAADEVINSQVSFNGGFDPEPGLADNITHAKHWTNGYRAGNGNWNLFYYGGAAGCPSDKNPNTSCTWAKTDIEYMAWTEGETNPFPQIYDEEPDWAEPPTSVNAQQWQKLSADVYLVYGRMNFSGGLSTKAACGTGCPGTKLAPKDSWKDLWSELNCIYDPDAYECNTADNLRWTTNIANNQETPSP